MRGEERQQRSMLMVLNLEQRVPREHPLRRIKQLAETVLQGLSASFDRMYSATGRPSIPPERLLKASLLMALYTVRSERLLCEQLDYNLLFRWFLEMELDEAGEFFRGVVAQARALKLLSGEHFTVDGTLIEAWASLKSFQRKGAEASKPADDDPGNPSVNFHGERRSNETHQSTTDPEALLARKGKGKEAKLCYSANALAARTTRHPGYAVSQWMRKRIEEGFGWMKTIGGLRKTRYRGRARVQWHAYLVAAAYNLLRIARLAPAPA